MFSTNAISSTRPPNLSQFPMIDFVKSPKGNSKNSMYGSKNARIMPRKKIQKQNAPQISHNEKAFPMTFKSVQLSLNKQKKSHEASSLNLFDNLRLINAEKMNSTPTQTGNFLQSNTIKGSNLKLRNKPSNQNQKNRQHSILTKSLPKKTITSNHRSMYLNANQSQCENFRLLAIKQMKSSLDQNKSYELKTGFIKAQNMQDYTRICRKTHHHSQEKNLHSIRLSQGEETLSGKRDLCAYRKEIKEIQATGMRPQWNNFQSTHSSFRNTFRCK